MRWSRLQLTGHWIPLSWHWRLAPAHEWKVTSFDLQDWDSPNSSHEGVSLTSPRVGIRCYTLTPVGWKLHFCTPLTLETDNRLTARTYEHCAYKVEFHRFIWTAFTSICSTLSCRQWMRRKFISRYSSCPITGSHVKDSPIKRTWSTFTSPCFLLR